ncbi:MAG: hypothetical protein UX80_C0032G0007 [Candidatus Amesbacteria bacterium GW2011_GWA2_47_11b]|uniref:Uncharacterized protein n=1 Tax=Candidatus Amesbacteria bacterium GW2011_GWA2_47_11b TaxID=1618358 RepID=A0A0G1UG71_9BACT|nr:MAG: hypothetical protein UX80_C0032G0007 [Candidatus Amesbacteria bacterium GW2011_GWA2_47_11b]
MPEHLQGTTWLLLEGEYLPLPNNQVIVGPKSIRVHDYGHNLEKNYHTFSVQLYKFYDLYGESKNFEDYVRTGTLPPELKPLS